MNKHKHLIILVLLFITSLFTLCSCDSNSDNCVHDWSVPTCLEPKTCTICGATEGRSLGHSWIEATYTTPKTCSLCGTTEGSALNTNMYEEIIYNFLEIDDELSRGWFDKNAQAFVKFIKGKNVPSDASVSDLLEIYKSFDDNIKNTNYCIRDFFTVINYNQPTNAGVYNFFEAINQLESTKFNNKDVVTINQNGTITGFDFGLAGGDAAIANALGISEELVDVMLYAAINAGFDVNFG